MFDRQTSAGMVGAWAHNNPITVIWARDISYFNAINIENVLWVVNSDCRIFNYLIQI